MRSTTLLTVGLLVSSALVITLGLQNRRLLAEQLASHTEAMKPDRGDWLPSTRERTIAGTESTLGADGRAQVIYFFDTGCPVCNASAAAIRKIALDIERSDIDVSLVGVGTGDRLDEYLVTNDFEFPVFPLSEKTSHLFRARLAPMLLAVNGDGQVIYSHVGAINVMEDAARLMSALQEMDIPQADSATGEGR